MPDFPLMLWMKLAFIYRIHSLSNKFATGMKNNTAGDYIINSSPDFHLVWRETMPCRLTKEWSCYDCGC